MPWDSHQLRSLRPWQCPYALSTCCLYMTTIIEPKISLKCTEVGGSPALPTRCHRDGSQHSPSRSAGRALGFTVTGCYRQQTYTFSRSLTSLKASYEYSRAPIMCLNTCTGITGIGTPKSLSPTDNLSQSHSGGKPTAAVMS